MRERDERERRERGEREERDRREREERERREREERDDQTLEIDILSDSKEQSLAGLLCII